MDVPWPLGLLLVLLGTPLTHAEPLYILVTPRVLRVGSPQNIHVQAHSDCGQPLTGPLEVNLMVWDFPMKRTVVATSQLMLSQENNFMVQAPVTGLSSSSSSIPGVYREPQDGSRDQDIHSGHQEPRRDHCDEPGSAGQQRFLRELLPPASQSSSVLGPGA
ncbi:uncharacterized protein [Equus asinus]|uniref:uncharacterized protein isoform X2 n=1 Tax=Equus asinus TaxID=9793 RepID=UPI0038F64244